MPSREQESAVMPQILKILKSIDDKMDRLVKVLALQQMPKLGEKIGSSKYPLDVDTMISLPDHLRKTTLAVGDIGDATADIVAQKTGRTRAAESDYLNQLVKMGLLEKFRKGRTVYFRFK